MSCGLPTGKPTMHLTLPEDLKISIRGQFCANGPKCGNQLHVPPPQREKFQACFHQNFTGNKAFPKWSH